MKFDLVIMICHSKIGYEISVFCFTICFLLGSIPVNTKGMYVQNFDGYIILLTASFFLYNFDRN
ncbi:unnamed protein product [Trifolium pratense]|uniref:Uncharacterized protein n=1 Tax=Trifolium pratense TaxID=57577 RepID=A0ACB0JUE1_TRIPR|nr:unnamed protein product [Trifolium pratense]